MKIVIMMLILSVGLLSFSSCIHKTIVIKEKKEIRIKKGKHNHGKSNKYKNKYKKKHKKYKKKHKQKHKDHDHRD